MSDLLQVRNLKKYYTARRGPVWNRTIHTVKAVDGVSFNLRQDQVMGLVGESGCGKTTLGMMLVGLEPPTEGEIFFKGDNLYSLDQNRLKAVRRNLQVIFQDPFASLDPMWNLGQIISEPFIIHGLYDEAERRERTVQLLNLVGLDGSYISRYPHELSGGQRQRVAIARALALEPSFIVADEPTSALDVSVKAQIINLLEKLQERIGLSMIFISHDLSVVYHICDFIQVMYFGKIVESGPVETLFSNPVHPYTRVLFESIPIADPRRRRERKHSYREHAEISEELLGPGFSIIHEDSGPDSAELFEIEPEHLVRCYRR